MQSRAVAFLFIGFVLVVVASLLLLIWATSGG